MSLEMKPAALRQPQFNQQTPLVSHEPTCPATPVTQRMSFCEKARQVDCYGREQWKKISSWIRFRSHNHILSYSPDEVHFLSKSLDCHTGSCDDTVFPSLGLAGSKEKWFKSNWTLGFMSHFKNTWKHFVSTGVLPRVVPRGFFQVKNGQDSRMGDTLLTWRDLQGLTFEFWQETGGMSII